MKKENEERSVSSIKYLKKILNREGLLGDTFGEIFIVPTDSVKVNDIYGYVQSRGEHYNIFIKSSHVVVYDRKSKKNNVLFGFDSFLKGTGFCFDSPIRTVISGNLITRGGTYKKLPKDHETFIELCAMPREDLIKLSASVNLLGGMIQAALSFSPNKALPKPRLLESKVFSILNKSDFIKEHRRDFKEKEAWLAAHPTYVPKPPYRVCK